MKNIIIIILIIVVFLGGISIGYLLTRPQHAIFKNEISSEIILQNLQNKGFLVTEDYVINQRVEIKKTSDVLWKDIIWGQKITATAVMKVSMGVDLSKLTKDEVMLSGDKVRIKLPALEVQSVELVSDINLDNEQGILKRLLDNDNGYNQALVQLKEEAKKSAQSPEVVKKAGDNAKAEIEKFIKLIVPQLNVEFAE
ncbi:MAG: hypothetical protein A2Y67_02920 [Candidatus Buchananbacteria bacterium RBG_13_39_9]|uniref:DUF4230 domain-containing protein n=1 Tax=Candidatus Buchananbacteria bacterium RBG_13_39_9 TaxID=1797531 RepID=A0A1G1XPV6_9BACT|nr:MAG: hypothetical protein A2Y67_02920 [Candidatus Buchananbacteria bacterium RBG_13_39_9]